MLRFRAEGTNAFNMVSLGQPGNRHLFGRDIHHFRRIAPLRRCAS